MLAWSQEQARLIRAGRFDLLDVEHIAEEIEDLGKSEQRDVDEEARDAKIYRCLADTAARHTPEQPRFYRDADLEEAVDWKWRRRPTPACAERYGSS